MRLNRHVGVPIRGLERRRSLPENRIPLNGLSSGDTMTSDVFTYYEKDVSVSNDVPKSTIELVMERLKQQDAEANTTATTPLTDEQREAIASVRRDYKAKVAEADILFSATLATTFDPETRLELEANRRRDLSRFVSSCDKKIDQIRKGVSSE